MTTDENENLPRELKFGKGISFRGKMKIPSKKIVTAVNSCQKLLTANENENQPRNLKFGTHIILRT